MCTVFISYGKLVHELLICSTKKKNSSWKKNNVCNDNNTYGVAAARAIAHPHIRSISHHYISRLKTRCIFAKQIFAQKTIGATLKWGVLGRQITPTTMQNTCFLHLRHNRAYVSKYDMYSGGKNTVTIIQTFVSLENVSKKLIFCN